MTREEYKNMVDAYYHAQEQEDEGLFFDWDEFELYKKKTEELKKAYKEYRRGTT